MWLRTYQELPEPGEAELDLICLKWNREGNREEPSLLGQLDREGQLQDADLVLGLADGTQRS